MTCKNKDTILRAQAEEITFKLRYCREKPDLQTVKLDETVCYCDGESCMDRGIIDDFLEALTRAHEQGHEQGKVVGRKEAKDAVEKLTYRDDLANDIIFDAISAIDDIDREGV